MGQETGHSAILFSCPFLLLYGSFRAKDQKKEIGQHSPKALAGLNWLTTRCTSLEPIPYAHPEGELPKVLSSYRSFIPRSWYFCKALILASQISYKRKKSFEVLTYEMT
ncbi:7-cyano-7-deazaguanine synthase [Striga asiatica]|uniref:7-cyano-7-deazaguanine synthase n=1 Tax=Striga asiatica TaxID=4170 RepID=A0A5A7Q1T0_STRAF|nr:7-cyano-7-deazaguanine synthase [Striga asiatica]